MFLDSRLITACQAARPALCTYLETHPLMSPDRIWSAALRYRLGAARDNGVVFWRIDTQENLHDGRIAFHTPDCRIDQTKPYTWISTRLKAQRQLPSDWQRTDCLFGEHLLSDIRPTDIIAIIEDETSAIILSTLFPDVIWMATGYGIQISVNTLVRLHTLTRGANMVIFPRTDPEGILFNRTEQTAARASSINRKPIYVCNNLESISPDQKTSYPDIVSWITHIRLPPPEKRIPTTNHQQPTINYHPLTLLKCTTTAQPCKIQKKYQPHTNNPPTNYQPHSYPKFNKL